MNKVVIKAEMNTELCAEGADMVDWPGLSPVKYQRHPSAGNICSR